MSNQILLILFLALLVIWIGNVWVNDMSTSSSSYAVSNRDTQTLQKIVFETSSASTYLSKEHQMWHVNSTYPVNENLRLQLFAVLESMEKRRAAKSTEYDTTQKIQRSIVHLFWQDQSSVSFEIIGLPLSQKSYIQYKDTLFELYIKGHAGYVAGIFFLSAQQWRHRQIFSTSVPTFRRLSVCYSSSPSDDFVLRRRADDRFQISSLSTLDTTRIYRYLSQYTSFYVNEYISKGQVPYYDSLMQTAPIAYLLLQDIFSKNTQHLTIYYQSEDPYFLLKDKEGSYALCERKRFLQFLRKKAFFTKKSF